MKFTTQFGCGLIGAIIFIFAFDSEANAQAQFNIEQVTFDAVDHSAPSINNAGVIAYMQGASGNEQIFSITPNGTVSLHTAPDATRGYTNAKYPSLADDGSFLCFRPHCTISGNVAGEIVKYPGAQLVEFCSTNTTSGAHRDPIPQSSISSDGQNRFWGRAFYSSLTSLSSRRFFRNGIEVSLPSTNVGWQNPSINNNGEFVYEQSGNIYSSDPGSPVPGLPFAGSYPRINNNRAIVYMDAPDIWIWERDQAGKHMRDFWVDAGEQPSINDARQVAFVRRVGAYLQIFRATPIPLEIVVTREERGLLERNFADYQGNLYWGLVTAYVGRMEYEIDGVKQTRQYWEAQDVVPVGVYSQSKDSFRVRAQKDGIYLKNAPVPALGSSSIFIHYGKFEDTLDSKKPWTSGCMVSLDFDEDFGPIGPTATAAPFLTYNVTVADETDASQRDVAGISGTVFLSTPSIKRGRKYPDYSGSMVVSGVTVNVYQGTTLIKSSNPTDANGHYNILLPRGTYRLEPTVLPAGTYRFEGLKPTTADGARSLVPLPWLDANFGSNLTVNTVSTATTAKPPDCYGVDFVAFPIPQLQRAAVSAPATVLGDGSIQVTISVKNAGTDTAQQVTLMSAKLDSRVATAGAPDVIGDVAAGGSFSPILRFPPGTALIVKATFQYQGFSPVTLSFKAKLTP